MARKIRFINVAVTAILLLAPTLSWSTSILVGGHLYGSPGNTSRFPASTLLGAQSFLKQLNPDVFISLGDASTCLSGEENELNTFYSNLGCDSIWRVTGNHDSACMTSYPVVRYRQVHQHLIILLESESNNCIYEPEHTKEVEKLIALQAWKSIHVFTHRVIWSALDETGLVQRLRNDPREGNFQQSILPLLKGAKTPVSIYSGNMTRVPLALHQQSDITCYNVSLGDGKYDHLLWLNIDDTIEIKTIDLNAKKTIAPAKFDLDYWAKIHPPQTKDSSYYAGIIGSFLVFVFFENAILGITSVMVLGTLLYLSFRWGKKKRLDR